MSQNHYMVEGSISIDPRKDLSEVDEDQCAVFSFPETMVDGEMDVESDRWSATALQAIEKFLISEGLQMVEPSSQLRRKRML